MPGSHGGDPHGPFPQHSQPPPPTAHPRGAAAAVTFAGVGAVYYFSQTRAADATESPARRDPARRAADSTAAPARPQAEWVALTETPALDPTPPAAPEPVDESLLPRSPAPAPGYLAEAERQEMAGDLLAARGTLNAALQTNALSREDAAAVKQRLRDLNRVIVFTPTKRFADDPHQGEHTVEKGDLLGKIALPLDVPYGLLERVNAVSANRIRPGQSLKTVRGPIHAVVSKGGFEMDLYLGALPGRPGSTYLTSFPVGLGADSSTPTGLWEVTRGGKLVNPEWTNPRTNQVFSRDDPQNPLGERWIGLTGIGGEALGQPSYGIHGTIEPETIGTNASMGCIRLVADDVAAVYDMLFEGKSTVLIVP